jgi:very-short-patch-repair endonuclease
MSSKYLSDRGHNLYLPELRQLARKNRRHLTKAELLIWNTCLKDKKLGYKFLRQKPMNRFIIDFYCPKLLLAIEIDGGSHTSRENYDLGRDEILQSIGVKTIRYDNRQVLSHLESIFEDVKIQINIRVNELKSSPVP